MFLPAELLSTATVATAEAGRLMKAIDRGGAVLWILEAEGVKFAVFLTGEHSRRAFEIKPSSGGIGCLVGPVQVRIDPSSVSNQDSDWSLKARGGLLQVGFQAEKQGGFPEHLWAPLAAMDTVDDPHLHFTKWSAGVDIDGEWIEVVSVTDGRLTTPLEGEAERPEGEQVR